MGRIELSDAVEFEQDSGANVDNLSRRKFWSPYISKKFWHEWKDVSRLAVPIMLTSLIEYLTAPISLFFCGKLGRTELAAAGLAISLFHTAGVSFIMGLLTAGETLFAQTFGGQNKFRLGIQVQRSFLILTLCCLPCWAVHLLIEQILLATNQPPLIAKYTGEYILGLMPGLLFFSIFEILTKYIQAQDKVLPPLIAGITGNIVNASAHYLFIYHSDVGFVGSAISQSLCYFFQASCILLYIIASRIYRRTWDGFHVESWHDWGVWFRLGVPGVVMFGLEWWVCEAGSLTAGIRGEEALAVQTILNNIESIIFCTFPMGYGIAVAIRVGQFVGSNDTVGPRSTVFVGIFTLVIVAIINSAFLLLGRYQIPRIFTNEAAIIEATAYGMPSVVAYQFFDCIVGVCSGVIRGVGMQKFGAIVCCITMYLIGGPLALCLLLLTDLVVPGFWWGLTVGMALETVVYIIQCCRIDWKKMCLQAEKRTEIKFIKPHLGQEAVRLAEPSVKTEGESGERSKDDVNYSDNVETVQVCTPLTLLTRSLLIGAFSTLLLVAVCVRCLVNWSSYFQTYCLLNNGTLLTLHNRTLAGVLDCTRVIP